MAENDKKMFITVDDGLIEVPILNKKGEEIGVFRFRPDDVGMVHRYNETVAKLEKVITELENAETDVDDSFDKAIKAAEKPLYEACDYLFGGNFSEAFFGKMHPFSPVNGRFYCETAIEAVGEFISHQFEQEVKKLQKVDSAVRKYTHGYESRTSKHKDGSK